MHLKGRKLTCTGRSNGPINNPLMLLLVDVLTSAELAKGDAAANIAAVSCDMNELPVPTGGTFPPKPIQVMQKRTIRRWNKMKKNWN